MITNVSINFTTGNIRISSSTRPAERQIGDVCVDKDGKRWTCVQVRNWVRRGKPMLQWKREDGEAYRCRKPYGATDIIRGGRRLQPDS